MQNRRKFVAKIGTVGTIAIAGCNGVGGEPELTVRNLDQTSPRVLDVSAERRVNLAEYSTEIRNTGHSGPVLVELFWGETTISPVREETTYFNSNETREFSFLEEPPEFTDLYRILATGLGYSADIVNSGGSGVVDVQLIDGISEDIIIEKRLNLAEDETRSVEFETEHEFRGDFVVDAVPAE